MIGGLMGFAAEHDDIIPATIPTAVSQITLTLLADGFSTPVAGVSAPYQTDELFIVDLNGQVTAVPINDNPADARLFLDVGPGGADLLVEPAPTFDERGLLGLAFAPAYPKTGLLYTYTSEPLGPSPDFTTLAEGEPRSPTGSLSVIREWRVIDPREPNATVDPASSRVLMSIEQPQKNHNAGDLAFGPDGMLYIALGDGGSSDDEGAGHGPDGEGSGQDLRDNNLLSKILRIDPHGTNSANGAYGIPQDNPFVGREGADEGFAYGLRNPYRMSFDHGTGTLLAADVGQRDIEEVNVIESGGNYGWPVKEGTFLFNNNGPNAKGFTGENSPGVPDTMIDPIAQYDHDEGTSITGGYVYRGAAVPELAGMYVFGDLTADANRLAGRLFLMDGSGGLSELVPRDPVSLAITGFGRDTQGELYVIGTGESGGTVYRIDPP